MRTFPRITTAIAIGFLVALGVTWALAGTIAFSMLVGIPTGIIATLIIYAVLAVQG